MRTSPLRGVRLLVIVVSLGLAAACGQPPVGDLPAPPGPAFAAAPRMTGSTPAPMPKNPARTRTTDTPQPRPDTGRLLARAAAGVETGAKLGAVVFDRTTGTFLVEHNADRPFRSASLVKLLIAVDVLARGSETRDRSRVARMLALSDDVLASGFWVRSGGAELVARTSARLGLTGVRPPETPGQWGEVVVTPRDVAATYRHVLGLPAADRDLIVNALTRAPRLAADGFDQHFGIPDGLRGPWAVKQGWGNNSAAMVLHSTGLVGPDLRYVVVLLTEHPLGAGWQTAASSVTAAAAALHGRLPGA